MKPNPDRDNVDAVLRTESVSQQARPAWTVTSRTSGEITWDDQEQCWVWNGWIEDVAEPAEEAQIEF